MMGIKPAFWLANVQEACERLAYFGIRAVLPLMMVSVGTGGLGLSMSQKGLIYGICEKDSDTSQSSFILRRQRRPLSLPRSALPQ